MVIYKIGEIGFDDAEQNITLDITQEVIDKMAPPNMSANAENLDKLGLQPGQYKVLQSDTATFHLEGLETRNVQFTLYKFSQSDIEMAHDSDQAVFMLQSIDPVVFHATFRFIGGLDQDTLDALGIKEVEIPTIKEEVTLEGIPASTRKAGMGYLEIDLPSGASVLIGPEFEINDHKALADCLYKALESNSRVRISGIEERSKYGGHGFILDTLQCAPVK